MTLTILSDLFKFGDCINYVAEPINDMQPIAEFTYIIEAKKSAKNAKELCLNCNGC